MIIGYCGHSNWKSEEKVDRFKKKRKYFESLNVDHGICGWSHLIHAGDDHNIRIVDAPV